MFFKDEYAFLSNFAPSKVKIMLVDGIEFTCPTVEHAYQATKCTKLADQLMIIAQSTPGRAKRCAREIDVDPFFKHFKESFMASLLIQKFRIPRYRDKLIATGQILLIEENTWHDNYWGECICDDCSVLSKNKLGELLMTIRDGLAR